jgi:hypothetical protein
MRVRTTFSVLLVAFICGCSSDHFTSGHGDVGQYILQQAIDRGGSPATNSLPVFSCRWRYSEDKDGVVIWMPREQFPAVTTFLRQAFGVPRIEPTVTPSGVELGVYRLSAKGGAIQFLCDAKRTQIIVIRPMTTDEIIDATVKALGSKTR